jgi:Flp pilus assembly pilin Flp
MLPHQASEFLRDDCGQDLVEYALLVAVVAITGGVALTPLTPSISVICSKIISVLAKNQ